MREAKKNTGLPFHASVHLQSVLCFLETEAVCSLYTPVASPPVTLYPRTTKLLLCLTQHVVSCLSVSVYLFFLTGMLLGKKFPTFFKESTLSRI